ncbi:7-carboxy-7-deazaguanine synthase QueE [Nocardiopsis sp. CNT312]|uniref:7-carboxy-7-deazaguanine synthase QueE n=1 Tax=Nocardiopsis sp. CNT312 TaxID=1137268 RepID=UPI0004920BFA|nr:7-carboxy-7-deazaguanine synthase QueE [Nocardiopsis sp. CNT312]
MSPAGAEQPPRLLVAETFGVEQPTFQGEGPSCGVPALFIRLSRCNLTCSWCDTPYTWDWARFDPHAESSRQTVRELLEWARSSDVELVVITGGEPLIQQQPLAVLVRGLLDGDKRVEFETNGTIAPGPDLLVEGVRFNVSPKLANSGVAESKRLAPTALVAFAASGRAVFKFVARTEADLEEIAGLADRYGLAPIWVMPEGTTPQELIATTRVLADAVAARRWNLAQRLHVMAFAELRGR